MNFSPARAARSTGQSLVAASLVCALLIGTPAGAQSPSTPGIDAPGQSAAAPKALHIVILEGDDALNNIRDRTAREPIVQIEDENHKPVAGALVLFTLTGGPSGAGGTFASSLTSLSVTTGPDGRAIAHGLQANHVAGKFTINVKATSGNLTTQTTINQTNVNQANTQAQQPNGNSSVSTIKKFGTKRTWLIASGAAAAAAVAVVLATRASATSITAGAGRVGP